MAIAPLGSIYKSLTFDGQTSASFGVEILGEGAFDAPERAVTMVNVPGRNGAIVIDQGYYENITVKYPATIVADTPEDFATGIAAFRNFLCSRIGYCRLSDDYNPGEYRMAVYKSGLEVSEKVLKAGEFDIVFECKPQRWLTSGETTVTVASGDVLTNPTLYGASPLLAVDGTGTINLGDQPITVQERALGKITVGNSQSFSGTPGTSDHMSGSFTIDTSNLVTGDTITLGAITFTDVYDSPSWDPTSSIEVVDDTTLNGASFNWNISGLTATKTLSIPAGITLTFGTPWSEGYFVSIKYMNPSGGYTETGFGIHPLSYDGASTISFTAAGQARESQCEATFGETTAVSTKTIHETVHIDLDVGEAYWIQDGKAVDANNLVALGSDLPVLEPGDNEITYDSTITGLKVTPRWWQL